MAAAASSVFANVTSSNDFLAGVYAKASIIHAPTLEEICFSQRLDDVVIRTLRTAFVSNRVALDLLKLEGVGPSKTTLQEVLALASDARAGSLQFSKCSIKHACTQLVAAHLSSLPTLTDLDLSNCFFNESVGTTLGESLIKHAKLRKLSLQKCGIDDKVAAPIVAALPTSLTYLNLSWNKLEKAVASLGEAILRTNLEELQLKCHRIPDSTLKFLISCIVGCPTMLRANIFQQELMREGARKLSEMVLADPCFPRLIQSCRVDGQPSDSRDMLVLQRKPRVAGAGAAVLADILRRSELSTSTEIVVIDSRISFLESSLVDQEKVLSEAEKTLDTRVTSTILPPSSITATPPPGPARPGVIKKAAPPPPAASGPKVTAVAPKVPAMEPTAASVTPPVGRSPLPVIPGSGKLGLLFVSPGPAKLVSVTPPPTAPASLSEIPSPGRPKDRARPLSFHPGMSGGLAELAAHPKMRSPSPSPSSPSLGALLDPSPVPPKGPGRPFRGFPAPVKTPSPASEPSSPTLSPGSKKLPLRPISAGFDPISTPPPGSPKAALAAAALSPPPAGHLSPSPIKGKVGPRPLSTPPGTIRPAGGFPKRGPMPPSVPWSALNLSGETLGTGAKARVLKATRSGEKVALKMFPNIAETKAKAIKEATIAFNCRHTHVVRCWGIADCPDGERCIVMERMDKGSAATLLNQKIREEGKFPYASIMRLAREISSALQLVHSKGVIHRDCKLENIVLKHTKPGRFEAKLTDFGSAIYCDEAVSGMPPEGSPSIMAPEVVNKQGFGPKSDIFGLAISLNELAATEIVGIVADPTPTPRHIKINPRFSALMGYTLQDCISVDPRARPTAEQLHSFVQFEHSRSKQRLLFDMRTPLSMIITNIEESCGSIFAVLQGHASNDFFVRDPTSPASTSRGAQVLWKSASDAFCNRGILVKDAAGGTAQVFCLDSGEFSAQPTKDLFALPLDLLPANQSSACVELRIAGVRSEMLPRDWCRRTQLKKGAEVTVTVLWQDGPVFYANIGLKGIPDSALTNLGKLDRSCYDVDGAKRERAMPLAQELERMLR